MIKRPFSPVCVAPGIAAVPSPDQVRSGSEVVRKAAAGPLRRGQGQEDHGGGVEGLHRGQSR